MSFPEYPSGPFSPEFCVGGFGGSPWSTCGWVTNQKALVVTKLEVWWNSSTLKAVQITYANSSISPIFGQTSGNGSSITFAPGERVTSLTLWGNGVGTRTGRIRITTSKGQTFDVGKNTDGQNSYSAPIGSGILVGMVGRGGQDIDMLGAVFLEGSVSSISIGDIQYNDSLDGTKKGLSQVTLSRVHYQGAPVTGTNYNFENKVERTVSLSFSQTSSTMYGLSVGASVTAEVFGIGGTVETGFEWQTTNTEETTTSTSTLMGLTWGTHGHVEPGKGLTCTSLSEMGVGNATYNSTVTVKLSDGTVSSYKEPGVFNNVVYTEAWVTEIPDVNGKPQVPIEGPRPPPS